MLFDLSHQNSALLSKIQRNSFVFSLLLHLLLLSSYVLIWPFSKPKNELPSLYIPSYTYQENNAPTSQPIQANNTPKQQQTNPVSQPTPVKPITQAKQTAEIGLKVAEQQKKIQQKQQLTNAAASKPAHRSPPVTAVHTKQNAQPVHLVGDKKLDQPLIELLGKALSSHLVYPRIAIDFNLHGTVFVGFMLHSSGLVTEAKVVKSSGTDILDKAALEGVQAMSPVSGVNQYLEKKRFLVVGIIFG